MLFDLDLLKLAWKAVFQALNSSWSFKQVSWLISGIRPSFATCCEHLHTHMATFFDMQVGDLLH